MQSIKRTYEQIVKRLREERIGFDHQLTALERTFAAKQRDYEELLLLSGGANHAREVAQSELSHVRNGYEEERRRRDLELRERHQMVQLRKQTLGTFQRHESRIFMTNMSQTMVRGQWLLSKAQHCSDQKSALNSEQKSTFLRGPSERSRKRQVTAAG